VAQIERKRMRFASIILASVTVAVAVPAPISAQFLAKRHQIELRLGFWNQVTEAGAGVGGTTATVGSTGFLGGIAYGHWLRENLALRASVGAMAGSIGTEVGVWGVNTELAVVTPLLVGLKYYFPASSYGSNVRPYISGSAGGFVGAQQRVETGAGVTVEERTQTAVGGEGGVGIDFLLGNHVMLTMLAAYDLMTDFGQPIGGSENFSGPQLSMGVSFVFGAGSN
jgi:outer membrane protein W